MADEPVRTQLLWHRCGWTRDGLESRHRQGADLRQADPNDGAGTDPVSAEKVIQPVRMTKPQSGLPGATEANLRH